MQFEISSTALKNEVTLLQGIAEKKSGIAALSSLLIETTDTGIRLTGTDLDTTIQATVEATIIKSGSVCLPAKRLCDIVKSLDSGTIKFKKEDNDWVRLNCNTSKFRVAGLSKDQFPTVPTVDKDSVVMDGDSLTNLIKHTAFAITQDESRYVLSGAKLEVSDGKVTMVATDGHRISIMTDDIEDDESTIDVLIPKRALIEIPKFADGEVAITTDANHIKFQSGDRILISRKLSANFPDYEKAIPKDNDVVVTFDGGEMVKGLKRVAITADENNKAIKITLSENQMILSSSADGESEELIKCKADNLPDDGLEIYLNWTYLIDFLATCAAPQFKLKDSSSSVQITDGKAMCIVMPLRAG